MISDSKNLKSVEQFNLSLAQTILWCAPRASLTNAANCLRTPDLRPNLFELDRFSAVETVAEARRYRGGESFRHAQIPKNLGGGRLLALFPEQNLIDGAAALETYGFLDDYNFPAWDTWVAFFEDDPNDSYGSYLIAWIPPIFVELVSDGINVNPEECILWLSDTNVNFAQKLRREGLLR